MIVLQLFRMEPSHSLQSQTMLVPFVMAIGSIYCGVGEQELWAACTLSVCLYAAVMHTTPNHQVTCPCFDSCCMVRVFRGKAIVLLQCRAGYWHFGGVVGGCTCCRQE